MKKWKKQVFIIIMIISLMTALAACGGNDANGGGDAEKTIVYGQGGAWNRLMPYDLIGMFSIMPNEKIFDKMCIRDRNIGTFFAIFRYKSIDRNRHNVT